MSEYNGPTCLTSLSKTNLWLRPCIAGVACMWMLIVIGAACLPAVVDGAFLPIKSSSIIDRTLPHRSISFKLCQSTNDDDDDKYSNKRTTMNDEEADKFLSDMPQKVFGSLKEQRQVADESRPTDNDDAAGSSLPGGLSKADLYNDEELQKVWWAHQGLMAMTADSEEPSSALAASSSALTESDVPSLHQQLLSQLGNVDALSPCMAPPLEVVETTTTTVPSWLDDNFQERIKNIRCIASDVDGTLLTSTYTMHPRTKLAIQEALERVSDPMDKLEHFFPATGKSRRGCLNSLPKDVAALLRKVPGVFIQGLYVVDDDGSIVFEKKLSRDALAAGEELAGRLGTSVIAYNGDELYTTELTETAKTLATRYGEPMAIEIDTPLHEHPGNGMHKLLLLDMDINKLTNVIRPQLEEVAKKFDAEVTQAMPAILELLPPGCSKALGVRKLCEHRGIDMGLELLAMGDAENDVQLLQQASIGVAMGNASPPASDAADFKMEETNNDGGAGAAMETFGFGYAVGIIDNN